MTGWRFAKTTAVRDAAGKIVYRVCICGTRMYRGTVATWEGQRVWVCPSCRAHVNRVPEEDIALWVAQEN